MDKMKLSILLLCCGLVCLVEQVSTKPAPDQDVGSSRALRAQIEVDAPDPWSLSVGDSVQIRCSLVPGSDLDKTQKLELRLERTMMSSIEILHTEQSSTEFSYSLEPVTLRHRGLYSCGGHTYNPHLTVEAAHKFIWVNDSSAAVSLKLLRVNRVKYFHSKTITIGCQLPNDGSEWMIMSASEKTGSVAECPNQERSGDVLSCTISVPAFPFAQLGSYDPFWCEASTIHKSNVLNMTEVALTELLRRSLVWPKFDVTPAWFVREGDSAIIKCSVQRDSKYNRDKFDLQLIWTKMDSGNNMTVLLSQRASKPIKYTLNNITHEHSGVYSCWDDGTLSDAFVMVSHYFIWVQDDSPPPVIIDVLSHNRTQFFNKEVMTVGCQLPNDQSQWKLNHFNRLRGMIEECVKVELSSGRLLSCTVNMGTSLTYHLFWCESATGQRSNVLNVTYSVGYDVLEAPPLPVMEGDDLTLRCLQKNKATGQITTDKAFFRRNYLRFAWSDSGSITIKNVTKENEGLYNCRLKDSGLTLGTYVTVKARPQEQTETN